MHYTPTEYADQADIDFIDISLPRLISMPAAITLTLA
jgi:hypothetical protein